MQHKQTFEMLFGPPFSSGQPHYGHLTNFILKDVILGIHKLLGYEIKGESLRFDVHGLPVELQVQKLIEKEYNITNVQDIIEKLGYEKYMNISRKYVNDVIEQWPLIFRDICPNLGYNIKSTMDFEYMQSVWYIFSQLYQKNLIYIGNKVQPYSANCETALSNFEAKQNYKSVTEQSIYFTLSLKEQFMNKNVNLIVWTTTPFTLYSNLAICINLNIEYCLWEQNNKWYITSQHYANLQTNVTTKLAITATQLKNLEYNPLFELNPNPYYRIVWDNYVNEQTGTGLVHLAPAYGIDDYRICQNFNIITKTGQGCFDMTDSKMCFNDNAPEYLQKQEARKCNPNIIKLIDSKKCLYNTEMIKHELPHCWRTDMPLYYKLVETVNLDVSTLKQDLIKNFETINFPNEIGKERMRDSLENAPDWCLSRSRIWGTPIPMWRSDTGDIYVPNTILELENIIKAPITDLHLGSIPEKIYIQEKEYRHINYVLDCWMESGSQFMAQNGYCGETQDVTIADFILEGIDQTRGWFYTLLVLGTALINKSPYKNIIINGLVLDKTGQKFSKRLQNYKSITEIITTYGIDATRLYFISTPASCGTSFKFNENHIAEYNKSVIIPLKNTFALFQEYYKLFCKMHPNANFDILHEDSINIWIVYQLQLFKNNIVTHVKQFKLFELGKYITDFVEKLNNYYCKFNRNQIKGKVPDKWATTISTLGNILTELTIILAAICPNLSEWLFINLQQVGFLKQDLNLHSLTLTDIGIFKIMPEYETEINTVDMIFRQIHHILTYRGKHSLTVKRPLSKVIFGLQAHEFAYVNNFKQYYELIQEQSNVFELEYLDQNCEKQIQVNISYFNDNMKQYIAPLIAHLKNTENNKLETINLFKDGKIIFQNIEFNFKYFNIVYHYEDKPGYDKFENDNMVIYVDLSESEEINNNHIARIFATNIQQFRKLNNIHVTDKISIRYQTEPKLDMIICQNYDFIKNIINVDFNKFNNLEHDFINNIYAKSQELTYQEHKWIIYIRKYNDV